jgi:hypothetical protein
VLAFTLLASLASAVLFALAPALAASGATLSERLKEGGRGGESRRQGRARGVLVVANTLSVLLLIGAGLIRSFSLLGRVNPRFQAPPDRVLTMFVSLTGPRFDKPGALAAYWDQLLERVRILPGAEAASLSIIRFCEAVPSADRTASRHQIVSLLAYPRLVTSFRAPFANPRRDRPPLGDYSLPIIHRVGRNGYCRVFR